VKSKLLLKLSLAFYQTDSKRSLDFADESVRAAEKSGSSGVLISSLLNAGMISVHLGLPDRAAEYMTRNITVSKEKGGSKRDLAWAYCNLGAVEQAMEDYDKAENHQLEAFRLLTEHAAEKHDSIRLWELVSINNNLGAIYLKKKEIQKAEEHLIKGIKNARRLTHSSQSLGIMLNNYGELQIVQRNFDGARKSLEESYQIRLKIGDKGGQAGCLLSLGNLYDNLNDYPAALKSYRQCFNIASQLNLVELGKQSALALSHEFENLGKKDSVLRYLVVSKEFEEKIKKVKAAEVLTRAEMNEVFSGKDREKEKTHNKIVIRFVVVLTGVVLFSLFFVFLFWITDKKNKSIKSDNKFLQGEASRLKNENEELGSDIDSKNKQLASDVIYKLQSNKIIEEVVDKLQLNSVDQSQDSREKIRQIVQDLGKKKDDTVWKDLETRFREFDPEFYKNLHIRCSNLTANERRLCTFLRLNMSSKEISGLTGQTLRSVDIARFRIRQKFNITNKDTGLSEFLNSI
jgi:tetratricopeptide (TPR) repeat protein